MGIGSALKSHKDKVTHFSTIPGPEWTLNKTLVAPIPSSAHSWDKCLLGHWAGENHQAWPRQSLLPVCQTSYWAVGSGPQSSLYTEECVLCAPPTGPQWKPWGWGQLWKGSHCSLAAACRPALTSSHGKPQLQGPMAQGIGQSLGQLHISVLKEPRGGPWSLLTLNSG